MRGRKTALVVILTEAEFDPLRTWSRSTTTAVGLVCRANAVLAVHAGQTVKQAAKSRGLSETHMRKWLKRFWISVFQGYRNWQDRGVPRLFPPQVALHAVNIACEGPGYLRTVSMPVGLPGDRA